MKEFVSAYEEVERDINEEEDVIEFTLDGRKMRAYPPDEGQLTFLMASLGRGQTDQSRVASVTNIMLSCFDEDDKDYLEGRLLTRRKKDKLPLKKLEEIFEYLIGEWFDHPTQPSSDSAPTQQ